VSNGAAAAKIWLQPIRIEFARASTPPSRFTMNAFEPFFWTVCGSCRS
jgi:hypothetical protein